MAIFMHNYKYLSAKRDQFSLSYHCHKPTKRNRYSGMNGKKCKPISGLFDETNIARHTMQEI
jgi:hypothetical protein